MMELLGIQEVAALLGWSRQRVNNHYRRDKGNPLPEPHALIGGNRPVWTREQIDKWIEGEGK